MQADLMFAGSDGDMRILAFLPMDRPLFEDEPVTANASLTDLITGQSRSIASVDPFEYTLPLDATHIYRLRMDVEGSPFKGRNEIFVEFENVSNVVPAALLPGAALLGAIGLNCAAWWLRRREN